jgi:hypothetical protein
MTVVRGLVSMSKLALMNDNRVWATAPEAMPTIHRLEFEILHGINE